MRMMIDSEHPADVRAGPRRAHGSPEAERGVVLCLATQLEQTLGEILREFLMSGPATDQLLEGALSSLEQRAMACLSLALIDEHESADCEAISRICAEFHRSPFATLESDRPASICRKPRFRDKTRAGSAREQFTSAAAVLLQRLANRGFYVGGEKRTPRNWSM